MTVMGGDGGVRRAALVACFVLAAACAGRSIDRAEPASDAMSGGSPGHATSGNGSAARDAGTGGKGSTGASGVTGAGGSMSTPGPPCGDGVHDGFEECDDGNFRGNDGCTVGCRVERDAVCPLAGPCLLPVCGDGKVARTFEACDDGNILHGDGCSGCVVDKGWLCPAEGVPCRRICDGSTGPCDVVVAPGGDVCGDGVVAGAEECDEGAFANDGRYAGCLPTCRFAAYCGDGVVNGPEECDEEFGELYSPTPTAACTPACLRAGYCDDGAVDANWGEQCDDGDRNGRSFCLDYCVLSGK